MRLPSEEEEHLYSIPSFMTILAAVTMFMVIILIVVLFINREPQPSSPKLEQTVIERQEDQHVVKGTLSPDDLDFWDKYPENTEDAISTEETQEEQIEEDPSTDGKHTLIQYASGEEEWVLISPYLPKHEYDFTKLVCQSELMKYYEEGRKVSYVGADISKFQDYVDFVKLKKAGIDYVMVRVGARGYSSGQLVLDDYFKENVKRALDAGLEVGVYFFSQAISKEEAVEEANLVIENLKEYKITYPVAFMMEPIVNDASRIDALSKAEKTEIAISFLDTVKAAGYIPMLYGDKEWLIKDVDMSKLIEYDIWLAQYEDIPDYPYEFSMWQYKVDGVVDGIAGYTNLNISFIDYSEK